MPGRHSSLAPSPLTTAGPHYSPLWFESDAALLIQSAAGVTRLSGDRTRKLQFPQRAGRPVGRSSWPPRTVSRVLGGGPRLRSFGAALQRKRRDAPALASADDTPTGSAPRKLRGAWHRANRHHHAAQLRRQRPRRAGRRHARGRRATRQESRPRACRNWARLAPLMVVGWSRPARSGCSCWASARSSGKRASSASTPTRGASRTASWPTTRAPSPASMAGARSCSSAAKRARPARAPLLASSGARLGQRLRAPSRAPWSARCRRGCACRREPSHPR